MGSVPLQLSASSPRQRIRRLLVTGLLALFLPLASVAQGHASELGELLDLPPGERYWQLRFLQGITTGIEPELLVALEARFGPPSGEVPTIPDVSTLQGAGYRIARADAVLIGLADLAAFQARAGDDLTEELSRLETEHPELLERIDPELLAEEILLVRSAVLDSLETLEAEGEWTGDIGLAGYQAGTLRARNELEYMVFARDIDALADNAIVESTGRLEAFHRMMDDNADTAYLRERIMAAEEMNAQLSEEHRQYARRRMIRNLIFLLPAISSYFRYR